MSGIMSMLLGAVSSAAAAADEFFNRVTLLLNTGSTNGAQNNTFLDSSSNTFTITRNGNTTQGTFTPFSQTGWSSYFNRTNYQNIQVASSADFDMGSGAGNFTIEFWANFNSLPGGSNFHWLMQGNNQGGIFLFGASPNIYWRNAADQDLATNVNAGITTGVWYHFAFVRSSSTYSIYKDGALLTSGTGTPSASANQQLFIGTPNSYTGGLDGYISNFRFTRSAVYTSAFTVTTSPLTTTSQSVSSSDVKLLTLQSNRFVDNSTQNTKTILLGDNGSNLGTRFIQAFSPFAPTAAYDSAVVGGSGYFDGTGDYLSVADNAAFDFSAGNFTIECWLYPTSHPTAVYLVSQANSTDYAPVACFLSAGKPGLAATSASGSWTINATSTTTLALNSWSHVAYVRSGNKWSVYINGVETVLAASTSVTVYNSTDPLGIGGEATTSLTYPYFGYMSDVRIVKGTAVYTAAFTPPTAPLTNIANTSLLLNYTNAGIFDAAAKNVLETVGNAQVSTTQAKFGTTSMYFDGTGDYIPSNVPSSNLYTFGTGDFTVEFWAYLNSTSGSQGFIDFRPAATNGPQIIIYVSSGVLGFQHTSSPRITGATLSTGQWYHIALARSGTNTKLFLNGTQTGSTYSSDTTSYNTGANRPVLGTDGATPSTNNLNGYMDEVRITNGYARYTANFTAPTAAFPTQ